jgi:aminoglycoside phosphotransferase (APT) family kinase protein
VGSRNADSRGAGPPATLVHGDLTARNAGVDRDDALVLIDWEHVGVGPVGFDLGTFVSLYRAFGGQEDWTSQPSLRSTAKPSASWPKPTYATPPHWASPSPT